MECMVRIGSNIEESDPGPSVSRCVSGDPGCDRARDDNRPNGKCNDHRTETLLQKVQPNGKNNFHQEEAMPLPQRTV